MGYVSSTPFALLVGVVNLKENIAVLFQIENKL
jgi:hypothetical protein